MRRPSTTAAFRVVGRREPGGVRWASGRLRRWLLLGLAVLLLPVPWQLQTDSGLGVAWGLDNRLIVDGQRLDPPGQWSFLSAGRPTTIAELGWEQGSRLLDPSATSGARDLRVGTAQHRPVVAEPAAAALGLQAVRAVRARYVPDNVDVGEVDAVIGGHGPPYSWLRGMSMGSSHGLMVALVTYAAISEEDLAGGRHVAGTGWLDEDGRVGRIGGLHAKAMGARRAGVDTLLVPASQADEIDGMWLAGMEVLAVETLDDAIFQLRRTRPPRLVTAGVTRAD